jgi:hypothetical protein
MKFVVEARAVELDAKLSAIGADYVRPRLKHKMIRKRKYIEEHLDEVEQRERAKGGVCLLEDL